MDNVDLKKVVIGILIGVILIFGLWYYLYYSNASDKIKRLQNDIARLYKYKQQMPVLLKKYEKAQLEFRQYSKQLPLKEEIPNLLVKLSGIIRSEGVSLQFFNPKKAVKDKSGIYYVKPIYIGMKSTYKECGEVFEKISQMKRLVKIKDFRIGGAKVVSINKVLLNIRFTAETYYLANKR